MISETVSDWVRKNANGLQPKIASKIYRGISMAIAIATDRAAGHVITEGISLPVWIF